MKDEFIKYLKGLSGLNAIINGKIFPQRAPQSASATSPEKISEPYIVWKRVSPVDHDRHLLGPSGLVSEVFQLFIYDLDSETAETIAQLLRLKLDGFRGDMNGENVRSIVLDEEDDELEDRADGSEDDSYTIRQDYIVTHLETVPVFP